MYAGRCETLYHLLREAYLHALVTPLPAPAEYENDPGFSMTV